MQSFALNAGKRFCYICSGRDVPWNSCTSYGSDNASVMVGKKNSVLS